MTKHTLPKPLPRIQRYLSAEKMKADDFGKPFTFTEGELVFDAKTRRGPWATMTAGSFASHGIALGPGLGQKYQRQANGQLYKIEG